MSFRSFRGIIPPVPTILHEDGSLNREGMGNMIDFLIKGGVDTLFFIGSAGEFSQMSTEFRMEVAEFCVKYTGHRLPVIIGIAAPGTLETIRLGLHAQEIGADGVVVVNPYYAIHKPDNIYNHYKAIAEQVDLPIILYNFPALTNQDLSPELVKRLALEFPNIVGIKDTVDTMRHIRNVIHAVKPVRPDFAVFSGYDEYMLDTLIAGGDGAFPSSANFAPQIACGLYKAFAEKDGQRMIELQLQLSYIPALFGLESPFYSVVKESAKMVGISITTHVLPPAASLSEDKKAIIRQTLRKIGVLTD